MNNQYNQLKQIENRQKDIRYNIKNAYPWKFDTHSPAQVLDATIRNEAEPRKKTQGHKYV